MEIPENNLRHLSVALTEGVSNQFPPASLRLYKNSCNRIEKFAAAEGTDAYSTELHERYLAGIDAELSNITICLGCHRFQKRVVRMTDSLTVTGRTDFSRAPMKMVKYPLDAEGMQLVNAILDENCISERRKIDLTAPMRHLFWGVDARIFGKGSKSRFTPLSDRGDLESILSIPRELSPEFGV